MLIGILIFAVLIIASLCQNKASKEKNTTQTTVQKKEKKHKLTVEERITKIREKAVTKHYPKDVIWLLDNNLETLAFVEHYEEKKNKSPAEDIGDDFVANEIPTLYQWDERWGYTDYNSTVLARSGCGPTALSMVLICLMDDKTITPDKVAKFAEEKGYTDNEHGTAWGLMKEAPSHWEVQIKEGAPSDENWVKSMLDMGNPIIASVGPGNFTDSGHFIVLTSYQEGYVTVHDPFREENTKKPWKYADIYQQIKAMWAYTK